MASASPRCSQQFHRPGTPRSNTASPASVLTKIVGQRKSDYLAFSTEPAFPRRPVPYPRLAIAAVVPARMRRSDAGRHAVLVLVRFLQRECLPKRLSDSVTPFPGARLAIVDAVEPGKPSRKILTPSRPFA